jgi:hypothetical protein
VNIAPTLLYSLGLPIPSSMEGKPELTAFEPSFLAAHPVRQEAGGLRPPKSRAAGAPFARDRDEQEALVEQLKALGYLE